MATEASEFDSLVGAFQIDKTDPNLAAWIGLRRNDPDVAMGGFLSTFLKQTATSGTIGRWSPIA
jgi:hypothetical protein